ncbi:VWA domain-containing protein [Candidatus Sumerlaeota bacterium]|nr:VWA domain-containing protein [Candidatus Sumerlaeota bacterium]
MILTFAYPQGLLIGLMLVYLFVRRLPRRNLWRWTLLVAAVLLLGYPSLKRSTKAFDLYLLVDRSRSISDEAREKEIELMELARRNLSPGDRLGIVSFNERTFIEQSPDSETVVQSFGIPYSEDASDLAEGLQTVLNLTSPHRRTRVLILSDGEYTGRSPVREAHLARQRDIALFYRDLKRAEVFNLSIRDVETPDQILTDEPFRVAFRVIASQATRGRYRLYRDNRVVGASESEGWRQYDFKAGENSIFFVDSLKTPGIKSYRLEVEAVPREQETLVKDNFAEKFVKVVGERPLLLINNTGGADNVSRVLSAGGLKAHVVAYGDYRMGINQLEGYKGVILNNVPVVEMPLRQIEALRDFALEEGGGLLVCGGKRSFAAGGFYKSPLDPVLPVSLEDRRESKKVSTAFSVVLDRSGSMAMTTPSGETKMSLADHAAVECLNLMSEADSISVIAVDSLAHIMVPQQPVTNRNAIASDILRIESMGGGIFVYTGLVAAGLEIARATQINKHILLFADAADSEEPGSYERLLKDYTDAGITVSVVGLGSESDSDAEFLKDVAKRGNGSVYFTDDAKQLIQFFTADTITYTRNSFIQDPAPMQVRAGAYAISPEQKWGDFSCGGYNLLFQRPEAQVAIETTDEDQAPVVAFWQRGLGRIATLALDAEGEFAGKDNYPDIVLSLARWIMGSNVQDNLQIDVRYEGTYGHVRMEVSEEERGRMGQATLQVFTPGGRTIARPLQWESHNRLGTDLNLTETGCYRGVVQVGGQTYKIAPMSLPVSPEFSYEREAHFGRETLARLASITGGGKVANVKELFEDPAKSSVVTPVVIPLLILALAMLLLDVAETRFGMLPALAHTAKRYLRRFQAARSEGARVRRERKGPTPRPRGAALKGGRGEAEVVTESETPEGEAVEAGPSEPAPEPEDEMDYLARSKNQADRHLGRGGKS